ncbi:5-methylcytosine-specific restriction protein B [Cellulophaga sp. RHA19]|uniref:McrB family protein n=1 Tax=Cellulophaga sp. RHA19 TaxID=1798237 RepID=UPI000CA87279|nr:AAA family ATPase [Cellulophaga sp. RHA19]PKB44197.1 5-methylcytosine-specific restriction protein B [Cellulophaga sp. RHA19]
MISYKEYEKVVFEWLIQKHKKDSDFTFSLRKKGSKGAEQDYFIGREKSKYFGMTFWNIPTGGYPGSTGGCITLIFSYSKDTYSYRFEFVQSKNYNDLQNKSIIKLLLKVKKSIESSIGFSYISPVENKKLILHTKQIKSSYISLETMLVDVDKELNILIPAVNNAIAEIKLDNPEFIGYRFTINEFNKMLNKLKKRLKTAPTKHSKTDQSTLIREKYSNWLKGNEKSNKVNSYLRSIEILNEILAKDIYLENDIESLTLLYKDLIKQQGNENSRYYYEKAPSYGNSGFYSASVKSFIDFLNEESMISSKSNKELKPINQILYGPPGTGKTYFFKNELFEKYTSKQTSITKEQHFETVVGNCSWWQVIAIALLDLGKSKVTNIFEHKWVQKKASLSNSKTIRPTLWGQLQSHTVNECKHVNVSSRQQPLIFNKTEDSYWEILEEEVKELTPELYDFRDSVENYNPDPDKVVKHYNFVTFHQSFAYEDFIEGIKPILPENIEEAGDLGYRIEDGIFKDLCIKAKNDPSKRYAIFIDEVNRGNVSAIFGELITLIETDKRKGAKNEMSITLPYSKKEFSVPKNLDIYGTMNTADRSVEALDTALRRRFEFKEVMTNYNVIKNEEVDGIKLAGVLKIINERIELLLDRDHTIGHSYFIGLDKNKKLANVFNNKIVPLLQEYFYGDYGKIGLVLGDGFVEEKKNKDLNFSSFKYDGKEDFIAPTYHLKKVTSENIIEAVKNIFNTDNN